MAQQHGEGCFCYDCVTRWAAEHDPNTGRRRSSGRSYGPPIAKNPANQEYINQCWKEEQERKGATREKNRSQRRGRRSDEQRRGRQDATGWTPAGSQAPDVGVVAGTDHVVSFKTKNDQRRTIIADGDYSDDRQRFRDAHNDYGEKREQPGSHFSEDRGHYTGPDH